MAAFGEELRRQREERGMSVEFVCNVTKVSLKHIRALEAGQFREMPGGVFRRGFVRSYLAAVGLDERPWMERFEATCRETGVTDPADTEWATFAENVKNSRSVRRRKTGLRWFGVAAMLTFLMVGGWCCWRLVTHQRLIQPMQAWVHRKSTVDNSPLR